jgi:hypothetical protein
MSKYQMNKNAENMNVNVPRGLSMNILLANTKQVMSSKFLTYSAHDNNCRQSLILAMLQSNNLSTPQNVSFTK